MRVYINEQFLKRTRRLSTILFFASLGILGGGLAISYSVNYANSILLLVPVVAMPIGLLTTWWSVRLSNEYVRKPHPEDVLQDAFKSAGAHSVSYHYLFKAKHVLVCAQGVYVIVTRFQEGLFRGRNEQVINPRSRNPIGALLTLMRQEQMGDPIKEAQIAATELQARLEENDLVVELVVLRRRRIVEHVAARQVIRVREPMIDPRNEIVFAGDPRTAKNKISYVARAGSARIASGSAALDGTVRFRKEV